MPYGLNILNTLMLLHATGLYHKEFASIAIIFLGFGGHRAHDGATKGSEIPAHTCNISRQCNKRHIEKKFSHSSVKLYIYRLGLNIYVPIYIPVESLVLLMPQGVCFTDPLQFWGYK